MTRPGTCDRTAAAMRSFLEALASSTFHLGVQNAKGMMRLDHRSPEQILGCIARLRFHSTKGNHIYIQPAGEHTLTLLDDLDAASVQRLDHEGYDPATVVETSPGNFQAWLKHPERLTDEQATLAARLLAERFGADPNAAGKQRFGRLPGFTNTKDKYRDVHGRFPYVLLHGHSGCTFPRAGSFREELKRHLEVEPGQSDSARPQTLSPRRGGRYSHLSLPRFRELPQYASQPARADMAFARAARSLGMPATEIADTLDLHYPSRNASITRKKA